MKEERMQILQMVADGKITVDEADKLIEALGTETVSDSRKRILSGKFLRVRVTQGMEAKVNVNIPLELARIVMRFLPKDSQLKSIDIDEVVRLVKEGAEGKIVEVQDDNERVEVFVD